MAFALNIRMKKLILLFTLLLLPIAHTSAQELVVKDKVIDLGELNDIRYGGTKTLRLKLNEDSPESFKLRFNYLYDVTTKQLDTVVIGSGGGISELQYRQHRQTYKARKNLNFDISRSSVNCQGQEMILVVEIKKIKGSDKLDIKTEIIGAGDIIKKEKGLQGVLSDRFVIEQ
jgi:hypothetical protein